MADARSYDYIIVGGGSAGCVLANRLSEDPAITVLLVEAGGEDSNPFIHVPLGVGRLHRRKMFDWGLESEPEAGVCGRTLPAIRGKVLGGSSSVNLTAFTRGDAGDFDRWAENGASGWSFADLLPYFRRLESWEGGESTSRGGSGPLGVQWARGEEPLLAAAVEAARSIGIAANPDPQSGSMEGIALAQSTIRNGRRASSAAAYLRPARDRPNLEVCVQATAGCILLDGMRAHGIEYYDRNLRPTAVHAEREVILCGGAFNSPQLLMLSGIGPADQLRSHEIKVVADLPVGQNLQDHVIAGSLYARRDGSPFRAQMRSDRMLLNLVRARLFGTGYAAGVPAAVMAFVRSDPALTVPDMEVILPTPPMTAHPWFPALRPAFDDAFGVRCLNLRPKSRGEVTLRSRSPIDRVRIAYNIFSDPEDLDRLRRAFRLGRELAHQPALDRFRGDELAPGVEVESDADIDLYLRRTALSANHPGCTCAMGQGSGTVVDPELRVHGVEGLRVVDASVMPDLVSGHINAAVLAIAERAADLIRFGHAVTVANARKQAPEGRASERVS